MIRQIEPRDVIPLLVYGRKIYCVCFSNSPYVVELGNFNTFGVILDMTKNPDNLFFEKMEDE